MKIYLISFFCFISINLAAQNAFIWSHGGIIRGDTDSKKIALVFSADEFGDGAKNIRQTLRKNHVNASFFFTGKFLEHPVYKKTTKKLLKDGNYIGSHSYGHLLYCDWNKRDSLLITKDEFLHDMEKSYQLLNRFGVSKSHAHYFMPPYEWYNDYISQWTFEFGLQVINFTPGTYSNADYTTPDMGKRYLSSDTIYNRIMRFESEKPSGLNGFILLLHAGTDPKRTDKFYNKLEQLIVELRSKGYSFVRIDELLAG